MNSQSHRLNFNAARGCLVAVAEIGPVYIRTPIQKFQRNSTQSRSWVNQHNQESIQKDDLENNVCLPAAACGKCRGGSGVGATAGNGEIAHRGSDG
jgi:hypothetical protein